MPSIWDLPQQEPKRGPAMDEARRRAVAMLGLLGAGLPTSSELGTSVLYDSGRMDAMAGGPTRGEFRDTQQQKVGQVALGLLGAIQPLWHGSPHKFSKFDLSKMGTGEGNQTYGVGSYHGEARGTGETYQYGLGGIDTKQTASGLPLRGRLPDMLEEAFSEARTNYGTTRGISAKAAGEVVMERLRKQERDALKSGDMEWYKKISDQMTDLQRYMEDPPKPAGFLYESRLRWPDAAREAADPLGPGHFLDWDKPLSEQGEALKDALRKADLMDESVWPHYTGEQLYQGEMNARGPWKQSGWADSAAAPAVSEMLRKAGVPGLRYLDAGSRGTGQGTHNYVVFDDNLIEILKRNGVPVEGLLD